MTKIVLIHGAWAGDWCWYRLVPELLALGHQPSTLNLDRHVYAGARRQIATLADYMDQLLQHLNGIDGPVYLVADNIAGVCANETAERHPHRIAGLIYLSGLFAPPGEVHPPIYRDSFAREARRIVQTGQLQVLRPDQEEELFYHDCDAATVAQVKGRVVEEIGDFEPPALDRPVTFWPDIPKAYVLTAQNRGVTPEQQRDIIQRYGITSVAEMDTGSCPHLSAPKTLAGHIDHLIDELSIS